MTQGRRTLGTYRLGVATGCFAVWDADGIRRTGFVEGARRRPTPCCGSPSAGAGRGQRPGPLGLRLLFE